MADDANEAIARLFKSATTFAGIETDTLRDRLIDGIIDSDDRVVVDLASPVRLKDCPTQQTVLVN